MNRAAGFDQGVDQDSVQGLDQGSDQVDGCHSLALGCKHELMEMPTNPHGRSIRPASF
jgi:hypothetical protein